MLLLTYIETYMLCCHGLAKYIMLTGQICQRFLCIDLIHIHQNQICPSYYTYV